jgi:hypothetical protein
MERREAQGSRRKRARAPRDPHPLKTTWVPESWRATPASQAGEGSFAGSLAPAASRVYPTCALMMSISATAEIVRAPSPRRRGRKTGMRANPAARNQNAGAAERWLFAGLRFEVRCLTIESDAMVPRSSARSSPGEAGRLARSLGGAKRHRGSASMFTPDFASAKSGLRLLFRPTDLAMVGRI